MSNKLFSPFSARGLDLANRMVMAPMTRNRADGNVPNDLMAEYYGQRAGAGLIVTEGTSPSPNGLGYPRIPGSFNQAQADGWKKVTSAVHAKGGKIFQQMMHTGRIGHQANLPAGAKIVAPSAVAAAGQIYTDSQGMQAHPVPHALSIEEVKSTVQEYVTAAKFAMAAGFDGVELHAANGYLIEQFIHPHSNRRTDEYGGSIENRLRFLVEVASAVAAAIGKDKVGVRLSPYGVFNDLPPYSEVEETYALAAKKLQEVGILYIHIVDHSSMGAPAVSDSVKASIRKEFQGIVILSGGYDVARANADIDAGKGDLIAFGKQFLANPDLVVRLEKGKALNAFDMGTFYTPGPKGYIDYPVAG